MIRIPIWICAESSILIKLKIMDSINETNKKIILATVFVVLGLGLFLLGTLVGKNRKVLNKNGLPVGSENGNGVINEDPNPNAKGSDNGTFLMPPPEIRNAPAGNSADDGALEKNNVGDTNLEDVDNTSSDVTGTGSGSGSFISVPPEFLGSQEENAN